MIPHLSIAAATSGMPEAIRSWPLVGSREGVWFIASLLGVAMAFFLWAIFFRRPSRGPRYKFPHRPPGTDGAGLEPARARARRRKRRKERRNPTLAETGGLPPVRSLESGTPPKET
jgi:hypothetical protein